MTRYALRERPSDIAAPALRWIGIAIVAGAVLAALGPFGTYMHGGSLQRASYWIAAMLLGFLLYGTAVSIVTKLLPSGHFMWWPSLIGATLLASVPEAIATRAGASRLWPELAQHHLPLPLWFAQTAMIGLLATFGAVFVLNRSRSAQPDRAVSPVPLQADTIALGREVLALQMEDHYVRLYRPNGSELILMPLGRAIRRVEMAGL